MNYDDNIGKNIREVRLEKGFSQEELARNCGFSNTTLSAYENRRKIPNLTTIAKIAKELDVTIERLYYGDENISFIPHGSASPRRPPFPATSADRFRSYQYTRLAS